MLFVPLTYTHYLSYSQHNRMCDRATLVCVLFVWFRNEDYRDHILHARVLMLRSLLCERVLRKTVLMPSCI